MGEAPEVDYQGGKEAAGYHDGHSADTKSLWPCLFFSNAGVYGKLIDKWE